MATAEILKADDADGTRRYAITATDDEGDTHTTRVVIPEDVDDIDDYLNKQARRAYQVIGNRKQERQENPWQTTTPVRTVEDTELKNRSASLRTP